MHIDKIRELSLQYAKGNRPGQSKKSKMLSKHASTKHKQRQQPMKVYVKRNVLLAALGFKYYRLYLTSPLWQSIRSKKLAKNPDCFGCGRVATQVHHGKYTKENLSGLDDKYLFSVCKSCHFKSEFTVRGDKRGVKKATKTLTEISNKSRWTAREFGTHVLYGYETLNELDRELRDIFRN